MSQYKSQVQNQFLSQARKRHLKVEVILETGTVLRGKLKAYDQFSVSLSFKDKVEIVYKSSIIYISVLPPLRPPTGRMQSRPPYPPRSGGYRRPEGEDTRPLPKPAARRPFPDFEEDIDNDPPPPKKIVIKKI
ncbi:MAG: RNA chaperone Hfq [Candidatus Riflebacteria bacterium]|nr:RNA chaperone Hfq [Candidatus Riflebacteria bacterium]